MIASTFFFVNCLMVFQITPLQEKQGFLVQCFSMHVLIRPTLLKKYKINMLKCWKLVIVVTLTPGYCLLDNSYQH